MINLLPPWGISPDPSTQLSNRLARLRSDLQFLDRRIISNLKAPAICRKHFQASVKARECICTTKAAVDDLLVRHVDASTTRRALTGLAAQVHDVLADSAFPFDSHGAQVLRQAVRCLFESDHGLDRLGTYAPLEETTVRVPSTLLYHAHCSLFPAERMIVTSGRHWAGGLALENSFDVTGVASAGHVRADPEKLGRALIAMSVSDAHMAAWIHSHPGYGIGSTLPSHIDLEQEKDWLSEFSPLLLGLIVVADGFVRFWGQAVEQKQVHIVIDGPGVIQQESNDHVYKLSF